MLDKEKGAWPFPQLVGGEETKPDPNPIVGYCAKCGMAIHSVMMYTCQSNPCGAALGSKVMM